MKSDSDSLTSPLSEGSNINAPNDANDDQNKNLENTEEVEKKFSTTYRLISEKAISLKANYVLFVDGTRSSKVNVGVGFSNKKCSIFSVDESSLTKVHELTPHQDVIIGIKFCNENSDLFFSGSKDGIIKLWDLREPTNKCSLEFKESNSVTNKALTCFDVSNNDRLICGGTELIGGDSFILFWDIRNTNLLGGYWESHTDDITQVKFHKSNPNLLASGSTDGLVNIFDLAESNEDDALLYTFNTNSSVDQIGWFLSHNKKDAISCVTHTGVLQLWQIEDDAFYVDFSRESISEKLHERISIDDCYIANVHDIKDQGELMVLTGSNAGKGEELYAINVKNSLLTPNAQFLGNKQIIRSSWFCEKDNLMVTGGESGFLSVWKPGSAPEPSKKLKSESSLKSKNITKPY